jgi:hypothetical protein
MKPIGAKMRAHRRGSHVPVPYTFLKAVPLHTLGAAFAEVSTWQMRRPQGPRTLASRRALLFTYFSQVPRPAHIAGRAPFLTSWRGLRFGALLPPRVLPLQ